MTPDVIFATQFVLSLVVGTLIARWYIWPRLAPLSTRRALLPLLFVHATRYVGLVFLVPSVVPPGVPGAFAKPAAYGDLIAALLALLAIVALRHQWPGAFGLAWLFNLIGVADLLYAVAQGVRLDVQLGAAYFIPILAVPALVITHAMIFLLLGRPRG
jgi:hypothetical protein